MTVFGEFSGRNMRKGRILIDIVAIAEQKEGEAHHKEREDALMKFISRR